MSDGIVPDRAALDRLLAVVEQMRPGKRGGVTSKGLPAFTQALAAFDRAVGGKL